MHEYLFTDTLSVDMNSKLNVALKTAIIESRRTQKRIGTLARIEQSRLSKIIHGDLHATEIERARLAAILNKPAFELFPDEATA